MKLGNKKRLLKTAMAMFYKTFVPWIVILYVLVFAHMVINLIYWSHLA